MKTKAPSTRDLARQSGGSVDALARLLVRWRYAEWDHDAVAMAAVLLGKNIPTADDEQ